MRFGGLHVWTRSLTRPVSRNARLSTGDSAGATGLFRVDADTAPFGSEDATPGSRVCVRVRAPLGRVGRAGLPVAFWCASPFPLAGLGALFVCLAPSRLGLPCLWLLLCFFFSFPWCPPAVSGVPCFPARGASGLAVFWSSPPAPPLLFFFLLFFPVGAPVVSGVPCFPARGALGLASCPPARPLLFFLFFSFFSPPSHPPAFFFCLPCSCFLFVFVLFCFLFPSASSFFSFAVLCRLCGVGAGLCVLGCGAWWCVLLWALCPGGGRFALALCCSVLPGCAFSLCVVACRVARVRWRRAGGVSLPRAAFGALLVCFVLWSCSAALAACRCSWVLWWGRLVAPGLVVLFRLALVCVVLVSLVWCFAPLWGAVWCCPPPPAPPGAVRCLIFLLFFPTCAGCAAPPRLVVVRCVVRCCASCRVVLRSVVCFVFCPVLCGVLVLGWVLAPCCCSLLPLPGPLSWPVVVCCPGVRCCGVLLCRLSGGVLPSVSCLAGGALLFRSRLLVLCVVACGCRVFVAGSGCPRLFAAGVLCRGCSCLAAWPAALLCAVVCCGVPLPCAMSCVLWCCVAVWCRAVVPCCPFFFCWWCWFVFFHCVCGAVLRCASCCSVPVWSVLLLVPRAVVCRCVLWCLSWRSVVWWSSLVAWRGLSWCLDVPCCVLRCRVALWCRAAGLCCAFSFAAGVPFSFKNRFSVFENKNKTILYPTHTCRQAARPLRAHCLTCNPVASTMMASSLSSLSSSRF